MKVNKLSGISLVLLIAAGVFVQPGCGSNNQTNENAAATAEGEKLMAQSAPAADPAERGRYLVTIGSCNDCHSPKIFTPQGPIPDTTRPLSGAPADTKLPKLNPKDIRPDGWVYGTQDLTAWAGMWGVSYAANLTPDSATGLGSWTVEMFKSAIRTGKHMGVETGRPILPPMPWPFIAKMTDDDLNAVFAYLRTLKPIVNKVPANIAPPDLAKM